MWEKEKLLVTSHFSFSHSVFKRLVSQGCQKVTLCGKGLKKNTSELVKLLWESSLLSFFQPCFPTLLKHNYFFIHSLVIVYMFLLWISLIFFLIKDWVSESEISWSRYAWFASIRKKKHFSWFSPLGLQVTQNFVGCIKNVYINEVSLLYELANQNPAVVYHGGGSSNPDFICEEVVNIPLSFPSARSRLMLDATEEMKQYFEIEFDFKTVRNNAILLYASLMDVDTSFEFNFGYFEVRKKNPIIWLILWYYKIKIMICSNGNKFELKIISVFWYIPDIIPAQ